MTKLYEVFISICIASLWFSDISAQNAAVAVHRSFIYKRKNANQPANDHFILRTSHLVTRQAVNGDLSYILSGQYGDLVKNSFSVNFLQPTATASFAIKLSKTKPNDYNEIINLSSVPVVITHNQIDYAKNRKEWFRSSTCALQVKFIGGVNNNISNVFNVNQVNPKASLQIGCVWLLPGVYRYKNNAQIDDLSMKLLNAKFKRASSISAVQKLLNADNAYSRHRTHNPDPYVESLINVELENTIKTLSDSLNALMKAYPKGVQSDQDYIFDTFTPKRKIYQWMVLSGTPTYNQNIGFAPAGPVNSPFIDTARYITFTGGISYNMLFIQPGAAQSFFIGEKLSLGFADNTATASPVKLSSKDSPLDTINGVTVANPGISAQAYKVSDLQRNFVFDLTTNFIWFLDPKRIIGINTTLDVTQVHTKPTALNLTEGLTFSIPEAASSGSAAAGASGSGSKSIVNITPFLTIRDVTQGQIDTYTSFHLKNHATFGLTADVPFSIFGN